MSEHGRSERPMTLVLQLLGATAGVAALMTFVGGAILWIRFRELTLPADQAVTLLPEQLLLIVGAHSLAVPVGLGLLAALVLLLVETVTSAGRRDVARAVAVGVISTPFAVIAFLLVEPYDVWPEWLLTVLAVAVVIGLLVAVLVAEPRTGVLPWVMFAAFVVAGSVVALMRTTGAPAMEPVAVLLKEGQGGISGFYVGQTSDRVYIAPLPGNGDPGFPFADDVVDRVVEIDRDAVQQLTLREPTGVSPDEAGREQAQSLLEDLRVLVGGQPSPADTPVTTADPVTAFAPLVNLHSRERLWPISADDFLANSWLAWAHDEGCPDWTPSGEHVDDPSKVAGAKGRFDRPRLSGPAAYEHRPADDDCDDRAGAPIKASAHTRPFDARGRPDALAGEREGFYLDLDDAARGGTKRVRKEGPQAVYGPAPVYYERRSEGRGRLRITYWLFYALSRPPGSRAATGFLVHEGDWERISVLIEQKGDGAYLPLAVRYHAHDGSRDVPWAAVRRAGTPGSEASTHPVVYSALGSHASYWRAGRFENVFVAGGRRRFGVFDEALGCPGCPQWRTWESLRDAMAQPWYGFGGAWGDVGSDGGFTGPLGPSEYKSGSRGTPEETVHRTPAPVATPASVTPAPTATP